MRFLAAWVAATVFAVCLSWLGIRLVLDAAAELPEPELVAPSSEPVALLSTVVPRSMVPTTSTTATNTTSAQPRPGPCIESICAFRLRGGDVVARFSPNNVEAISATPRDGYSVSVEQPGGPLVVNFRSATGRLSRLEAVWSNGPKWNLVEQ